MPTLGDVLAPVQFIAELKMSKKFSSAFSVFYLTCANKTAGSGFSYPLQVQVLI